MGLGMGRKSGCRWPGTRSAGSLDRAPCLIVVEVLKVPQFATVQSCSDRAAGFGQWTEKQVAAARLQGICRENVQVVRAETESRKPSILAELSVRIMAKPHHAKLAARLSYASRAIQLGRETRNALTSCLDPSTGTGQGDIPCQVPLTL